MDTGRRVRRGLLWVVSWFVIMVPLTCHADARRSGAPGAATVEIQPTKDDGVRLAWQHFGRRVAYLAYRIQCSQSGIFELYWTHNGAREDAGMARRGQMAHIFNWVPKGPVEDTAHVTVARMPWDGNRMVVLATTEWETTQWTDETTGLSFDIDNVDGALSVAGITPEPVKSRIIKLREAIEPETDHFALPCDEPFRILKFSAAIGEEKQPEIWELYGNWLSQDNLIAEYRAQKSMRALTWLLTNVLEDGMKRKDVMRALGRGETANEKQDKIFRKMCRKRGLSVQDRDAFVMYESRGRGDWLQFRDGLLINHEPEDAIRSLFIGGLIASR